jgi:hypothetical protein
MIVGSLEFQVVPLEPADRLIISSGPGRVETILDGIVADGRFFRFDHFSGGPYRFS